jgi:hypothetical protein
MPSVSLYVYTSSSLAPEQLDGLYVYSVFRSLSVTGRCSLNMSILAPKMRALQMIPPPPKEQKRRFSQKDVLSDLVEFWYAMETVFGNKTVEAYVMYNGTHTKGPKRRFCRNLPHRSDGFHCFALFNNQQLYTWLKLISFPR